MKNLLLLFLLLSQTLFSQVVTSGGYALTNENGEVVDGNGMILSGTSFREYNFHARDAAMGTNYVGGFYFAPAADADLTQASLTVTLGGSNTPIGAHAFIVSSGNGTTDGSDLVLTVSGTSITDGGVRATSDTEVIEATAETSPVNTYFETTKKWIGTVTFTLSSTGGTTFDYTFNYGVTKYDDFGNRNFTVTFFEATGLANANDAGFDVKLLHHKTTGWTYSAAAFDPAGTVITGMNATYVTEIDLDSGEQFAFKRTGLSTIVTGDNGEGIMIQVITGANNSVSYMNMSIGATLSN